MLTKPLLAIVLAACGVTSTPATAEPPSEQPDDFAPPPEPPAEDQHFCCESIDTKTWTGDGCLPIGKEHMAKCATVLYCPGKWANENGKVTCG